MTDFCKVRVQFAKKKRHVKKWHRSMDVITNTTIKWLGEQSNIGETSLIPLIDDRKKQPLFAHKVKDSWSLKKLDDY